jgi:hypothetical protein
MSETMLSNPTLLEAKSEETSRALYAYDVNHLKAAIKATRPGIYEFEAQLPEVVGYVPEDEREAFDELLCTVRGINPYSGEINEKRIGPKSLGNMSWDKWPAEFIGIKKVILEDIIRLGLDYSNYYEHCLVDMDQDFRYVPQHVDGGVNTPEDATGIFYLFSGANRKPTLFFEGNAPVFWGFGINLVTGNPLPAESAVSAPNYGIVRCTYATVHASDPTNEKYELGGSLARVGFDSTVTL